MPQSNFHIYIYQMLSKSFACDSCTKTHVFPPQLVWTTWSSVFPIFYHRFQICPCLGPLATAGKYRVSATWVLQIKLYQLGQLRIYVFCIFAHTALNISSSYGMKIDINVPHVMTIKLPGPSGFCQLNKYQTNEMRLSCCRNGSILGRKRNIS